MAAEQSARADGNARITQVAGDHVTYGPGAGPVPPVRMGLPDAPPELVGRDRQSEELTALLAEGGGTPVAVVAGLAGVGKSALAVATAHRAVELGWFGDRVFFLPLRGYAAGGPVNGPQAVQEMLRHLGIRDADLPPSPEGRVALYRAELAALARAGRRVLIVADDAGSVAQVRDLVPPQDTHRLLVTSRHRLVAPGFPGRLVPLDELAAEPAAELLAGAVLRTWPDDPRPAAEAGALAEIAERCGRLPLALTVAGALLAGDPGLAVGELASQLADARTRLEALTFDDDEVPVGVRAAFDLSYERLPDDLKRIFRLLTVNPAPDCSTVYAQLLTGETGGLRLELAALVRASLLTEQPVGSGRWRMHDLVRLYALERGEECAEEDGREDVIDRLLGSLLFDLEVAHSVLGLNGPAAAGPGLPQVAEVLQWLDAERALLLAAVGFALEVGRWDIADGLADCLASYFQLYGYAQEALVLAHHLLTIARRVGDRQRIAMALYNLGSALTEAHQVAEATDRLTDSLALFREISLREGEGKALNLLGSLHLGMHRFEEAREANEGALEIFRELGIRHAEGTALIRLANVMERLGRVEEAIDAYRRAVALMQETGDRHREASGLSFLAEALWRAGHGAESLDVQERALATLRALGHRAKVAWSLNGLANSLLADGRPDEARARYEEALALFRETGNRHGEGSTLSNLGQLHMNTGRLEEALEVQERACALLAGTGDRDYEAAAVMGLAAILGLLHRHDEAVEAFERAAVLFGLVGDSLREAVAREGAAELRQKSAGPRRRWSRLKK